jgi:hypothetical protein
MSDFDDALREFNNSHAVRLVPERVRRQREARVALEQQHADERARRCPEPVRPPSRPFDREAALLIEGYAVALKRRYRVPYPWMDS